MPANQHEPTVAADANLEKKRVKTLAAEKARAKSARLRLMKERNENYLAEREVDDDFTLELRLAE